MQSTKQVPDMIQKEEVAHLRFPVEEVLLDPEDLSIRKMGLFYAAKLGNLDRYKVKITFEDNQVLQRVETTIWAVTEKMVVLKRGILIPIHRVHEVKFL